MGFFNANAEPAGRDRLTELLYKLECRACPLNRIAGNLHPHMEPTGAKHPKVYVLGEAPGETEDEEGVQFVGPSGELLRAYVPDEWLKHVRWNNVVRTRPPKNRDPSKTEIECCRPSVERDVAASKPVAIFGFGKFALQWATGRDGVELWSGRRLPVRIGGHECWFYPFVHPSYLLHLKTAKARKFNLRRSSPGEIATEPERAFAFHLRKAFAEVDHLPPAVVHDRSVAEYGVEIVTGKKRGDLERLEKLFAWAAKRKLVGYDKETSHIRPYHEGARILTAAVGTDELSFAFAVDHRETGFSREQRDRVKQMMVEFLESRVRKAVHNLSFEQEWSRVILKVNLRRGLWEDTLTQAHMIDERADKRKGKGQGPKSLDWLCQQYFGLNLKTLNANLDKSNLDGEPLDDVLRYNAPDAKYHCLLFHAQDEVICREGLIEQYRMVRARVPTCVMSQVKGVPIDQRVTKALDKKYAAEIEKAEAEIAALPEVRAFRKKFGEDYSPGSNPHTLKMIRDVIGSRAFEGAGEDGKDSVDEKVLKKVDHPLIAPLLRFRKVSKRRSTYLYREVDDKGKRIIWTDGLIHCNFNTTRVETWRLSGDDPNLMNIPKRVEENREVRKQIVAPPGFSIVSFDYGQIQPRCIAMVTKDPRFVKYLWDRHDVHADWAERLAYAYPKRVGGKAAIKDKKVMKKFRDTVKTHWVLAGFFGSTLRAAEGHLEVPEDTYRREREDFEEEFAGVFEWHRELQKFYHKYGYVETLLGLRRRAPLSYNQMINSPIQMMEGEIFMDGANRLSERADREGDDNYQPNVYIHDDMTFFLPDAEIDRYADGIITTMLDVPFDFVNVPITVEMSVGKDLFSMEEVLKASSDDWKKGSKR